MPSNFTKIDHRSHTSLCPLEADKKGGEMKEEMVPRSVMEDKLLVALDDSSKVAVVCNERMLDMMIAALATHPHTSDIPEQRQLAFDLKKLRKAAFGS